MNKKENIILDAKIKNVIGDAAFEATLENGHEIVAFALRRQKEKAGDIRIDDRVEVELSPYDMSKGRILFERTGKENES